MGGGERAKGKQGNGETQCLRVFERPRRVVSGGDRRDGWWAAASDRVGWREKDPA